MPEGQEIRNYANFLNDINGLPKLAEAILWKEYAISKVLHAGVEMALYRATPGIIECHFGRCRLGCLISRLDALKALLFCF